MFACVPLRSKSLIVSARPATAQTPKHASRRLKHLHCLDCLANGWSVQICLRHWSLWSLSLVAFNHLASWHLLASYDQGWFKCLRIQGCPASELSHQRLNQHAGAFRDWESPSTIRPCEGFNIHSYNVIYSVIYSVMYSNTRQHCTCITLSKVSLYL